MSPQRSFRSILSYMKDMSAVFFAGPTLKQKILNLCNKIKLINLFDSGANDAATIDRQRKITHLYAFLLMSIALFPRILRRSVRKDQQPGRQ